MGAWARVARGVAHRPPARGRARRGGERLVHASRRVGEGRADRRPHGLRPERRLARRLPQRPRRRRGAAPDRGGGNTSGHGAARRLGGRGGRAIRALALRLVRGRRVDGRPGRAPQARRPRGRGAPGRDRAVRRRPRPCARGPVAARLGRGLPRAPHRAGPGARVARPAARRRPRDVRRRALARHVDGTGGARRLDPDGPAPRRPRRRREAGARDSRRGPRDGRRRGLHVGGRRRAGPGS